jgi:hypothetical protein
MTSAKEEANERLREAAESGDIGGIRAAIADGADKLFVARAHAVLNHQAFAADYIQSVELSDPESVASKFQSVSCIYM